MLRHTSNINIGLTKDKMKCKFLLVVLVLEIVSCVGQDYPQLHYFKLALIWPNSFCLTSDVRCRLSVPQNFTIKAFWEEQVVLEDPTQLTYCNTNAELTDDMIFRHRRELLKFWPDLSTYNYNQSKKIWKGLWKKFGSCCSDNMPETYLVRSLRLREANNLYQILKSSGIVANGRSYPAYKILKAIRKGTGCLADIVCDSDREGSVFLSEIHLCIEYDGETFTDCQYVAQNCDNDPIFPDPYFR